VKKIFIASLIQGHEQPDMRPQTALFPSMNKPHNNIVVPKRKNPWHHLYYRV